MSEGALFKPGPEGLRSEFRSWQIAYGSANTWQRDYWLMDWMKQLRQLDYLTVLKSTRSLDDFPMLEVIGKYDIYRRNTEMVQLDLNALFARISRSYSANSAIRNTEEGFDFSFIAHSEKYSVSGVIRLSCTR